MTELGEGENTVSCHIWMVWRAYESILGAEPAENYSHVMWALHDSWLCWNTEHRKFVGRPGKSRPAVVNGVREILQS